MEEWLAEIRAALEIDDYAAALVKFDERATPLAGAPNAKDKRAVIALACEVLACDDERLDFARACLEHNTSGSRALATFVLRYAYASFPEEASALLHTLADDENWEVREWAGSAVGFVLDDWFAQFYPTLAEWAHDPSVNVRRAICIAVMEAAHKKKAERAEPLFALLDPLISDHAEYIRKNLGPFAIGACLLRAYPAVTTARLRYWLEHDDSDATRWNLAMTFSAAAARRELELGLELLSVLAADPHRFVWRATVLPLRNLAKADRNRVTSLLHSWRSDPTRQQAAEEALRYIEKDAGKES